MTHTSYRVGIDVGSYSVGLSAIEVDSDGMPVDILSAVSYIHDAGVDPTTQKTAATRLAVSGVARRTRRLFRRKRRRLLHLDNFIKSQGWPIEDNEEFQDPYLPWECRAQLVENYIEDQSTRELYLSVALRHIARHRGWRNPYTKVSSLYHPTEHSDAFAELKKNAEAESGIKFPESCTVATIVRALHRDGRRLRGGGGLLAVRLQQADHALEINQICAMQGIDDATRKEIIDHVFKAESPKGSAAGRVGKDPLDRGEYRASKATDAFQRYRIAALIGNLRIRQGTARRELTKEERQLVFDLLVNFKVSAQPAWTDVAEVLGIDRGDLVGTATMTDDGERAGARPPLHATNRVMAKCPVKPLKSWWQAASAAERAVMLKALSNGEMDDFDSPEGAIVQEFFATLSDEDHSKLDSLHLPSGRAAYSEKTLRRLTQRMLNDGVDLYEARRREFNVAPTWTPPVPDIGEPVGNPAVDRVLKIVARWLQAAESEWGTPLSINIESGRMAFLSEATARAEDRQIQQRTKRNQQLFAEMQQQLGISDKPRRSDLWRFQSVQRQNGECLYCGAPITYASCEMDHIVPRAGQGSTNRRENLVAVCGPCNRSKSNIPFAIWAEQTQNPEISVEKALARVDMWLKDPGLKAAQNKAFMQAVKDRLQRTTIDAEIDTRSAEAVGWMSNELRARIAQHYRGYLVDGKEVSVRVYRGEITSRARSASGIERQIQMIGGRGKHRLDRRHHAVDAAVIAFMQNIVAQVLVQRDELKKEQELLRIGPQWREFYGADETSQFVFNSWMHKMSRLVVLINAALQEDRIVVMSNLRLRLGNSEAHEAGIHSLKKLPVGGEISKTDIDRASSGALWCALTRHPDFDPKQGLPANPERTIRVHGTHFGPTDLVEFFPVGAAAIKVRGGYAELGSNFHHARIYRITSGKKVTYGMVRVYASDLLAHRREDLFSVELPPQSISLRYANPKTRDAIIRGEAQYLGWLVTDDELMIDASKFDANPLVAIQNVLGPIRRWRLDGFCAPDKLRLRPLQLSSEGIEKCKELTLCEENLKAAQTIIDDPGWRLSVSKLFTLGAVTVIRRDALGRARLHSNAGLPTSWKV